MIRSISHYAAVALRLLAIIVLVAVPIMIAVGCGISLAEHRYVQIFGKNIVGETRVACVVEDDWIFIDYCTGWDGTHPQRGGLYDGMGISVNRTIVTLTGQTRGDAILTIGVRWWLLLLANAALLLAAFLLARPLLRRRAKPGHCAACGYDLRATPQADGPLLERCPECGAVSQGAMRSDGIRMHSEIKSKS